MVLVLLLFFMARYKNKLRINFQGKRAKIHQSCQSYVKSLSIQRLTQICVMALLTKDSIGVFQAEANSASVVQLSSGPMKAATPASRICVIALETKS